jgi:hypothetical protein
VVESADDTFLSSKRASLRFQLALINRPPKRVNGSGGLQASTSFSLGERARLELTASKGALIELDRQTFQHCRGMFPALHAFMDLS